MQIPHCVRPRLKQFVLINISCNENLLVRKKLKLFCISQRKPLFSPLLACDVILWATILGEKKGDKTSCNNWLKRSSFVLSGARVSVSANVAKCSPSPKSIEIHTQFGTSARTYPRFTNLLLCTFYLAPCALPLLRSHSADGACSSCALKYRTALHHTTFIILSFWIFNSIGLARMNDTFQRAEQLQSGSSLSWQTLPHAMPDGRAGQVSGQGAALILHKYRGNPLLPICWKQHVLKGKVIYLSRCDHCVIIWKWVKKSQEKPAKPA